MLAFSSPAAHLPNLKRSMIRRVFMGLNWIDVSEVSFNYLLFLERMHVEWLVTSFENRKTLGTALNGNPVVVWYMKAKMPELSDEIDKITQEGITDPDRETLRKAEVQLMENINDWIVYLVDPEIYAGLKFMSWDPKALSSITDFSGKRVIDVGSGTGKQAFIAAELAQAVYCVEPVTRLRQYLISKAESLGLRNVFVTDGLITQIPFEDGFSDITMGGHVFGDEMEKEYTEMNRVTRPGGMIVFCPGSNSQEGPIHDFLKDAGFHWDEFEEPGEGIKRKYWKTT